MTTPDLITLCRACLDEEEAVAKAAGGDSWRASESGVYHEDAANFPGPFAVGPYEYLDDDERAHIALHDPDRTLREIAAKRAILANYEDALKADPRPGDEWAAGRAEGNLAAARFAMLRLAAIYVSVELPPKASRSGANRHE